MMALSVTLPVAEEEEAEIEEAKEEGGTIKVAGSVISTHGRFG